MKQKVLVITGLGNVGEAQYISRDLQNKGYNVDVVAWNGKVDYSANYKYVISHSAGTGQAQIYASRHKNTKVFIMGAPVDVRGQKNVVSVGQVFDPVSMLQAAFNLAKGKEPFDVVVWKGSIHSKNAMYDSIANRITNAVVLGGSKERGVVFGE